jgi:glycerophosphoryl diester phosphodiesterase
MYEVLRITKMKCWLLILSAAIMSNQVLAQTRKTLNIAHRGASGSAPENTLAAINKALEIGADIIEIDVHLSSDNQLIVIHDNTLDRTTTLKGNVKDHTLKELKNADAGSWFSPEFKNERIPTLDEVLYTINGKAILLIEIKDGSEVYPGIEKLTVEAVKRNGAESWCELQSFSQIAVEKMLEEKSSMPVYKLVVGNVPLLPLHHDGKMKSGSAYQYKNVTGINPNYRFAKKRVLKKLHERNQKMYVWTVNDEKLMKKLLLWGVDGIITNYPEKLKKLM